MVKHSIWPIALCKGPRYRSQWTYRMNYGQVVDSCNYVWYIKGSSLHILVDAGAQADAFRSRGISEEDIQPLDEGLRNIDLRPEDIDLVIFTHLHWDHVAQALKFHKARLLVQRAEYAAAQKPHPAIAGDYTPDQLNQLSFELIDGDCEVVDGVRVLFTPGHSPGGQSVAVQTSKGIAIITGFCSTYDNFEPPIELQAKGITVVAPGLQINLPQVYDSVLRVKQQADIILPLHDPAFINVKRIP